MSDDMVDRTIFVESIKLRVQIQQLDAATYLLTGTPVGRDGQPDSRDEVVADLTALEEIYAQLGLVEAGTLTSAAKRWLRPLWTTLEHPATRGWSCTRTVKEWKR